MFISNPSDAKKPLDDRHMLNMAYWADNYQVDVRKAYSKARNLMSSRAKLAEFHFGYQSCVYTFDTGLAIKISRIDPEHWALTWRAEYGKRSFDLPIIAEGEIECKDGIKFHWSIVPCVRVCSWCNDDDDRLVNMVCKEIADSTYHLQDFKTEQFGIWHGRAYLLDYNCAE